MKTIDLKPRPIAVLCALRSGPKTTNQLGTAIGDGSSRAGRQETRDLLIDMQRPGLDLIVEHEDRWYLDHDGLGWLQSNGLDAVKEVRIWNVGGGTQTAAMRCAARAIGCREGAATEQQTTALMIVAAARGVPPSVVHAVLGAPNVRPKKGTP